MIIIGEKINGSIPSVAEAIANKDAEFIKDRARKQAEANATFIDCCASVPEEQEVETLKWMIDCIQEVTDLPISVDSPSADVLAQAYKFCKRPGLFNSVSGEGDKIDKIFPIMAQEENKDWQVIALLSDDSGIPKNADFIFDMRYTANPFYIEELRCKSGRDEEVRRFIFSDANVRRQLNMIENMLDLVIPEFIKQGKRRLMVAFGCTGGRHRSVAMAEALHDRMKDKCSVLLEHRDLVSEADDIRTRFEPK